MEDIHNIHIRHIATIDDDNGGYKPTNITMEKHPYTNDVFWYLRLTAVHPTWQLCSHPGKAAFIYFTNRRSTMMTHSDLIPTCTSNCYKDCVQVVDLWLVGGLKQVYFFSDSGNFNSSQLMFFRVGSTTR